MAWSANGSSGFNLFITPQPGFAGAAPVQIDFTAAVSFTSISNNVFKSDGTLDSIIFQRR
jgi:hypothetical protein